MTMQQTAMGAIARGRRLIEAVGSDDPAFIVTWGEAVATVAQLIGDLLHEEREHEKTRDLLKLVERSSDRVIHLQRDALMELRSILAEHHDIEDGDGDRPEPRPNWAMRATQLIDEALSFPSPNPTPQNVGG